MRIIFLTVYANANNLLYTGRILLVWDTGARKMGKKLRKEEWAIEKSLEAALELMGWQAELLRAALRQSKKKTAQPPRQRKKTKE